MVGAPDDEAAEVPPSGGVACGAHGVGQEINLVTLNVDGLGDYRASPADRMEAILDEVLALEPDFLLLQEVVADMYAVALRSLQGWKLERRRSHAEEYFNVTAVLSAASSPTLSMQPTPGAMCLPSGGTAGPSPMSTLSQGATRTSGTRECSS